MKVLAILTILLASFLAIEAYNYDLTLTTFNYPTHQPVEGNIEIKAKLRDDALIYLRLQEQKIDGYKLLNTKFKYDKNITEIVLSFEPKKEKDTKFIVGPIILAELDGFGIDIFKPNIKFISGNNQVVYKKD